MYKKIFEVLKTLPILNSFLSGWRRERPALKVAGSKLHRGKVLFPLSDRAIKP